MLEIFTILLLLTIVLLLTVILNKIRKIHLSTYLLQTNSELIKIETMALYPQIQSYLDLNNLLNFKKPLPVLRGWAASPDFLNTLAKHTLTRKPTIALECSSGSSTIVLARCMQLLNEEGHVYSLEHSPEYAAQTRTELDRQGLSTWATVIDAPLIEITQAGESLWYDTTKIENLVNSVELLCIDGPPYSTNHLARYPAVPQLYKLLKEKCTIFLDDADRADEKKAVEKWLNEFPDLKSEYLNCEKGCVKITKVK